MFALFIFVCLVQSPGILAIELRNKSHWKTRQISTFLPKSFELGSTFIVCNEENQGFPIDGHIVACR